VTLYGVGLGPGDAGLVTVRGRDVLERIIRSSHARCDAAVMEIRIDTDLLESIITY